MGGESPGASESGKRSAAPTSVSMGAIQICERRWPVPRIGTARAVQVATGDGDGGKPIWIARCLGFPILATTSEWILRLPARQARVTLHADSPSVQSHLTMLQGIINRLAARGQRRKRRVGSRKPYPRCEGRHKTAGNSGPCRRPEPRCSSRGPVMRGHNGQRGPAHSRCLVVGFDWASLPRFNHPQHDSTTSRKQSMKDV